MKTIIKLALPALMCLAASDAKATILQLDIRGTAGFGLLSGNEPSLAFPTSSSGGEIGTGILYDDVANLLTLNVGWGSSQGFTDLSSLANNSHIHGPTAGNNGNNGTSNFTQTAGVLFNLSRSSNAVTGGTFTTTSITLTEPQEADLLNGKYYINIHTANNGGGEMRGFIVQSVPEPSTAILAAVGCAGVLLRRRRAQ